ncbi:hypothetical protein FACS189487_00320 [Campylobacterota bacterium]|nr:hypothetical protein FACS189487_00320 [Campylobacterota bacterium]
MIQDRSKSRFLIAYDIADTKRLRRVSKHIERIAFRIQRSLYYTEWENLDELMQTLAPVLAMVNPDYDDLRIFKISGTTYALPGAIDLENPLIIA